LQKLGIGGDGIFLGDLCSWDRQIPYSPRQGGLPGRYWGVGAKTTVEQQIGSQSRKHNNRQKQ
jgi:hypothetical protein